MFGLFKKRSEFEKLFGEYVSPEVLKALESGDFDSQLNQPKEARIEFVLAAVSGATPAEVGQRMGQVSDIALRCGWVVETMVSGVVVSIKGPFPWASSQPSVARSELASRLRTELGPSLKTIHGSEKGYFGTFGSQRRQTWGAYLPSFLKLLSELSNTPSGHDVDKDAG